MGNEMSLDTDTGSVVGSLSLLPAIFCWLMDFFSPVGAAQTPSLIPEEMHKEMLWGGRSLGGSHALNLSPTAQGWFAGGILGGSGC